MARKTVRKKARAKKRTWTREKSTVSEHRHWLGEELYSEEALRLELDPLLYAVDDALHRFINSAAHAYDGNEKRPVAIFLPIPDTIGWQVSYIAKQYNTYLLTEEEPDGLEEASDFFNIRPLDFDEFDSIEHWVDLFVTTSYIWSSAHEFFTFMNANLPLLSPDSRAYAVLRGRAPLTLSHDREIEMQWADGTSCSLAQLLSRRWYSGASVEVARTICLPSLNPCDPTRLSTFSKRNKKFFGEEIQSLLLQLLDSEPTFNTLFELPESGEESQWAVILSWKSPAKY